MCGIAGIIQYKHNCRMPDEVYQGMWQALMPRGRDDRGAVSWNVDTQPVMHSRIQEQFNPSALFSSRLSIQDLTPAGRMPMKTSNGRIWVVQNGEIYNFIELRQELESLGFKFASRSDTEVLLYGYQAWGSEGLFSRLNGDFAIAIVDFNERRLILARDRFGVKPLFYCFANGALRFASEIKAILQDPQVPVKPNDRMVFSYLSNMFPDPALDGQTFFDGIYQFPVMSWASISLDCWNDDLEFKRYWNPVLEKRIRQSDQEYCEGFHEKFMKSVKLRLRSDVQTGVFLSGGLDSSSIACAVDVLRKDQKDNPFHFGAQNFPIKTISALFPGSEHDEKGYMDLVLQKLSQADPYFLEFQPGDLAQLLRDVQYHHEEPLGPMNVVIQWELYRFAASQGIKVVFDGLGGDELLGGYRIYHDVSQSLMQRLPWPMRNVLRHLDRKRKFSYIDKRLRQRFRRWYQVDQKLDREDVLFSELKGDLDKFLFLSLTKSWMNNSVPLAARYSDRNGMACGVEPRVPFLDHELVEYVFSTSNDMKYRDQMDRFIQRQGLKDILPQPIAERKDKIGFQTPDSKWMKQFFAPLMKEFLKDKQMMSYGFVNADYCRNLLNNFVAGRAEYDRALWRIFCLFLWMDTCLLRGFKIRS